MANNYFINNIFFPNFFTIELAAIVYLLYQFQTKSELAHQFCV